MRTFRLSMMFVVALVVGLQSASLAITVVVNGHALPGYPRAVERGDRVLLPMRMVFESLQATVSWNTATQTAQAVRGTTTVRVTINSPVALVNNMRVTLDVPPRFIGGQTYVPVRFLAEAFGAEVGWVQATQTVTILLATGQGAGEKATGPLRVHPTNPRYFTDGSGRAIYLTGSHTWNNLQDGDWLFAMRPFDYNSYLDFLQAYNHNFIRLWTSESAANHLKDGTWSWVDPVPYLRTGPGEALDGKPRFDLTRLNRAYFDRLRQRVLAAGERGIYVSVMLFDAWGVGRYDNLGAWEGHPYHARNNVNGINGDPDGDGKGLESHTLQIPAITALQKAYVQEVVDTVNDLDNVLYEICNEDNAAGSVEWQYEMINYIKSYEAGKPKKHPVGMTLGPGGNGALFNGPADWISPNYGENLSAATGDKVVIYDTDHIWGEGGNQRWVWKTFTRGGNPIYMDRIAPLTGHPDGDIAGAEGVRKAMGHTRTMADRMNLADMVPRNDLASTQYCLANPGKEYLVYLPEGGEVTVDLSAATGTLAVEWMHPAEGTLTPGDAVAGGAKRTFRAPFEGDAAVRIAGPAYAEEVVVAQWEFNTEGDLGGWAGANHLRDAKVADGRLTVTATDGDPFLTTDVLATPIVTTPTQVIDLRLNSPVEGSGEFFWTNTTETEYAGFSPGKETYFSVTPGWQVYRVRPFWQAEGKIIKLRLDLPGIKKGTEEDRPYEIDYIRVVELGVVELGAASACVVSAITSVRSVTMIVSSIPVHSFQPGFSSACTRPIHSSNL